MKLYELTNDFQRLFDSLEDMTENAELTAEEKAEAEKVWFDTLECVEAEFTDKAENVAAYVRIFVFQQAVIIDLCPLHEGFRVCYLGTFPALCNAYLSHNALYFVKVDPLHTVHKISFKALCLLDFLLTSCFEGFLLCFKHFRLATQHLNISRNDLKLVDEALRTYYHLADEHICSECGKTIMSDGKRTVQQIIDGSMKNYGKQLCMKCVLKRVKAAKSNEAESVSE